MCGVDACLSIYNRESGRVYMFFADLSGFWGFVGVNKLIRYLYVITILMGY